MKTPLKPLGFENLPKGPPSCPFLLYQQSSQVGSLSPALTEDTMFVSQAEMGKDGWMQGVAAYERDL